MKIEINDNVMARLTEYLKETSFKNLGELIDFILNDYLDNNKAEAKKDTDKSILQERLKNLGYL